MNLNDGFWYLLDCGSHKRLKDKLKEIHGQASKE